MRLRSREGDRICQPEDRRLLYLETDLHHVRRTKRCNVRRKSDDAGRTVETSFDLMPRGGERCSRRTRALPRPGRNEGRFGSRMPQAQWGRLQPIAVSLILSPSGNASINRLRSPLSAGPILRPPHSHSHAAISSRGVARQKMSGLHRRMLRPSVSASSQGKACGSHPADPEGLAIPRLRRRS